MIDKERVNHIKYEAELLYTHASLVLKAINKYEKKEISEEILDSTAKELLNGFKYIQIKGDSKNEIFK